MASNLKYGDVTEKIIGCAITVHKKMGTGYSELIYSRCLAIEFDKPGLKYVKEWNGLFITMKLLLVKEEWILW